MQPITGSVVHIRLCIQIVLGHAYDWFVRMQISKRTPNTNNCFFKKDCLRTQEAEILKIFKILSLYLLFSTFIWAQIEHFKAPFIAKIRAEDWVN